MLHRFLHNTLSLFLLAVSALLSGCGKPEPARFHLNMVAAVKQKISPARQQEVADILTALFGTPDEPYVDDSLSDKLDLNKVRRAAGPAVSDIHSRKTGLYREHCGHCHGISGDGMGPTAAFLKPYPRDYRLGKFKFKMTNEANKPTHYDLQRILIDGIPGSSMPSFRLLSEQDRESLIEYVKYLALRGETELALYKYLEEEGLEEKDSFKFTRELLDERVAPVFVSWEKAQESLIQPATAPTFADLQNSQWIDDGRKLFYNEQKANCVKCHGSTAMGDGQREVEDDWSKQINEAIKVAQGNGQLLNLIGQYSLPIRLNQPRNLRSGIYRGGRMPLNIFQRIHTGINGSGMPGVADTIVSQEDKWKIVAYVLSLPYKPGGALLNKEDQASAIVKETN